MITWLKTSRARRVTGLRTLALLSAGAAAMACGKGAKDASDSASATQASGAKHADEGVVRLDTAGMRLGGIQVGAVEVITTSGLPVTGTITYDANRVSHIGSRTDGRVLALRAALGAAVGRGQSLAVLESPEVGQIRAEEREAEELVKIASENFAREGRLAEQGISSRKELLVAEAELRRAQASLRSAQVKLQVLGAAHDHGEGGRFTLVAPFSGVVVAREANVGEMATPADTLFTVADLSRVWIELDIFERDLARVREGQSVLVSVTAYGRRTFPGQIVYVGEVLDAARRTVRARVEIQNQGGALKPGMFATASIQVGAGGAAVVVVPQDAVQEVEGKQVVFVPGSKAGEFRVQAVEVGDQVDGKRVAIRAGLTPSSRIVVAGAFTLRSELAKAEIGGGGH